MHPPRQVQFCRERSPHPIQLLTLAIIQMPGLAVWDPLQDNRIARIDLGVSGDRLPIQNPPSCHNQRQPADL